MPRRTASAPSAVSDAVASRQPVRPHAHGACERGTGRWATSPAAAPGPWCTVPSIPKAASTTRPMNRCTRLRRASGRPKRISARATARAWLSIHTGSPSAADSSAASGLRLQPSAGCRTTVPSSGPTHPPRAAPTPRSGRPESYASRKRRSSEAIAADSPSDESPSCGKARRASSCPRRSTRLKVECGTPMCNPAATGPPTAPVCRSSGIRGRPTPPPGPGSSRSSPPRSSPVVCRDTAAGLSPHSGAIALRATGPWSSTVRSTVAALAAARLSPAIRVTRSPRGVCPPIMHGRSRMAVALRGHEIRPRFSAAGAGRRTRVKEQVAGVRGPGGGPGAGAYGGHGRGLTTAGAADTLRDMSANALLAPRLHTPGPCTEPGECPGRCPAPGRA